MRRLPSFFLFALLLALLCGCASAASPTPTAAPTHLPTPSPTSTPEPTTTLALPPEFLSQFQDSAYSLDGASIAYTPPTGEKTAIAKIESGQFVFQVAGQEVKVDLRLASLPDARWFLNGASDQIMAVYDETGTYWQYEFDLTSGQWLEKSLPQEVSTNVDAPTKITWNDIISRRWATAVRRAINAGKIPTFGPDLL